MKKSMFSFIGKKAPAEAPAPPVGDIIDLLT